MSIIYVSVRPEETRMGVTSSERLVDYVVERNSEQHLVSSVFQGRVANVLPGIQAAFIDIGKEQNAFNMRKRIIPCLRAAVGSSIC